MSRIKRAKSVKTILELKENVYDFKGDFFDAFSKPDRNGVWFIWGPSGSGKTRFALQLIRYMAGFEKVIINSREEGAESASFKKSLEDLNMALLEKKVQIVDESIEELTERLSQKRSPKVVLIDSIQEAGFTTRSFNEFADRFGKEKLIIVTSQTKGKNPWGAAANKAKFRAKLKIYVEGYRAFSNGRYYGEKPHYSIWPEKAAIYWLDGKA